MSGELLIAKFDLQRLPGKVTVLEDVDNMKLSYVPQVIHASCLGYQGFYALIDLSVDDGWVFHPSVFFHPNVRIDGWDDLIDMHSMEREVFYKEKLKYEVKMVAMKHIEYEETRKDKLDHMRFEGGFPGFPALPRFWVEATVGSSVSLWPPRLFRKWADAVARGEVLKLAPERGEKPSGPPIAGPPPSPSPSLTIELSTSHPLTPGPSNTRRSVTPLAGPSKLNDTSGENFGNFAFTEEELANIDLDDY